MVMAPHPDVCAAEQDCLRCRFFGELCVFVPVGLAILDHAKSVAFLEMLTVASAFGMSLFQNTRFVWLAPAVA